LESLDDVDCRRFRTSPELETIGPNGFQYSFV
jgi:hypothetical protein